MSKNLIITLACSLGLFVILGLVCMITNISLENKNVRQQEAIKAQQNPPVAAPYEYVAIMFENNKTFEKVWFHYPLYL